MAEGALANSRATLAVSVTGVAGPGGGTAEKPVGLVHLAATKQDGSVLHRKLNAGDIGRGAIRRASVAEAFAMLRHLS
jgi:nicotinamide-nucleotide amidase